MLAVAGGTVPWLRTVSVFETHDGSGPQDLPVTKCARAAGVTGDGHSTRRTRWRWCTAAPRRTLTLDDLAAMPQRTETLPIACVEGWSALGGVDRRAAARPARPRRRAARAPTVAVRSLQQPGRLPRPRSCRGNFADDDLTLLALQLDGEPLSIDHGYPCRLIAPNRPGVLQTKWVARIEVA